MTEFVVFLGALSGGFVSGLTGFGMALTALPFWAQVLPPVLASPLVLVTSVVAQMRTIGAIWPHMDLRRIAPYVIAGVMGVPVGVMLLPHVSPSVFRTSVGVMLVVACAVLLAFTSTSSRPSTRAGDAGVGFVGGILGGVAGLSGILPTIWAQVHGWDKVTSRAIFQGYNLCILFTAGIVQGFSGFLNMELARLALFAVPGSFLGAWLGHRVYHNLDTRRFSRVVLVLLMLGGLTLIASNVLRSGR